MYASANMRTFAALVLSLSCWAAFAAEQAVLLQTKGGQTFHASYSGAGSTPRAVIVLADPPREALTEALKQELARHGYAVLHAEPIAAAEKPGAIEQLRAAVDFLQGKGHFLIAIAAYDRAAVSANDYLSAVANNGIAAWACISVRGGELRDTAKLHLPTLDIYGAKDNREVLDKADARTATIRKMRGSAQIELAGADHDYTKEEPALATMVRQFLDERVK
jgi:pimeloyl-ACP methyl ester carboxylesterase